MISNILVIYESIVNSEYNDYTNESLALDLLVYRLTPWIALLLFMKKVGTSMQTLDIAIIG